MHLHILGICGTFMGGLALLARELGHTVTGSDAGVYPPMSSQLEAAGIALMDGYRAENLDVAGRDGPDLVIVGNALSRGNPEVEALLDRGLPYSSGPQWLGEQVLRERWVLAVAGTHGKTTTSSLLAWLLQRAGLEPGFLIGGVAENFGVSARLGRAPFFVIEADEYDTAFFDKRSKFVHYRPRTLVLNNLEFDHADIFDDLEAIKRQFHHLLRTVPGNGLLLVNADDANLPDVLARGQWTPAQTFGLAAGDWRAQAECPDDGRAFELIGPDGGRHPVHWSQGGRHNLANALAAVAAARHAGVPVAESVAALGEFAGARRRLQLRAEGRGMCVFDDFAHHPTAIATTIAALRARIPTRPAGGRLLAVLELRSNSMRSGAHLAALPAALGAADAVILYAPPELDCDLSALQQALGSRLTRLSSVEKITEHLISDGQHGDHILIMSNGAFGGLVDQVEGALAAN